MGQPAHPHVTPLEGGRDQRETLSDWLLPVPQGGRGAPATCQLQESEGTLGTQSTHC